MVISGQSLDVTAMLESSVARRFFSSLVMLAAVLLILDGYDAIALSVAAPSMMKAIGTDVRGFAAVIGLSQIGLALGAFLFGWIGDTLGRRPTIMVCLVFIAAFSLLTPFARTLGAMIWVRFVVAIAIGGIRPLLVALVSDFAPARSRASAVTLMYLGYGAGGLLVSLISAYVLTHFAWGVLFFIGGAGPLLLLPAVALLLPESVRFLINKSGAPEKIGKVVRRLDSTQICDTDTRYHLADESGSRAAASLNSLFFGPLRAITPLLWVSLFLNTVTTYFLGYWIPTLVHRAGGAPAQAGLALACWSAGGLMGGLGVMAAVQRLGFKSVVAVPLLAFAFVASLGMVSSRAASFYMLAGCAGFCILGANYTMIGLIGRIYPSSARSTGAGWALAASSLGSVIGPWMGGYLIAAAGRNANVFLVAATPLPFLAVSLAAIGWLLPRLESGFQEARSRLAAEPVKG